MTTNELTPSADCQLGYHSTCNDCACTCHDRYRDRDLSDDEATINTMAETWHNASNHAQDGYPYGSPLCNCDRVAAKAYKLGWR